MAQRGRKSLASLAVVTSLPGQRLEPPAGMSDEQAATWRSIVATKPADWFTADTMPLLQFYCEQVEAAGVIGRELRVSGQADLSDPAAMLRFSNALKMSDRMSRTLTGLARTMRLTQQSRYDHKTASTAARSGGAAKRPWEIGIA